MRRGRVRSTIGAIALISASLFLLPLSAAAAEGELDDGSVSVSVEIEPRECVGDECGGGGGAGGGGGSAPPETGGPGSDLAETGPAFVEPALWIALMLLAAGFAVALRLRATRPKRMGAAPARPTPYAVRSGELDPSARHTLDGGTAQAPHNRAG